MSACSFGESQVSPGDLLPKALLPRMKLLDLFLPAGLEKDVGNMATGPVEFFRMLFKVTLQVLVGKVFLLVARPAQLPGQLEFELLFGELSFLEILFQCLLFKTKSQFQFFPCQGNVLLAGCLVGALQVCKCEATLNDLLEKFLLDSRACLH